MDEGKQGAVVYSILFSLPVKKNIFYAVHFHSPHRGISFKLVCTDKIRLEFCVISTLMSFKQASSRHGSEKTETPTVFYCFFWFTWEAFYIIYTFCVSSAILMIQLLEVANTKNSSGCCNVTINYTISYYVLPFETITAVRRGTFLFEY